VIHAGCVDGLGERTVREAASEDASRAVAGHDRVTAARTCDGSAFLGHSGGRGQRRLESRVCVLGAGSYCVLSAWSRVCSREARVGRRGAG
jgi:hypothetical protein